MSYLKLKKSEEPRYLKTIKQTNIMNIFQLRM